MSIVPMSIVLSASVFIFHYPFFSGLLSLSLSILYPISGIKSILFSKFFKKFFENLTAITLSTIAQPVKVIKRTVKQHFADTGKMV